MKKIQYIIWVFILITNYTNAQNLKRANHLFETRAYISAAELYLKIEPKTQEILERLGDCYYFNTKMEPASHWYKLLLQSFEKDVNSTYFFKYSQTLKGTNQLKEAELWYTKYLEKKELTRKKVTETNTINENTKNTYPITIQNVTANTTYSDFGASFFNDKIIFSSTRNEGNSYQWNEQPYLDLFEAILTESGDIITPKPIAGNINTKLHESNAIVTKDGKTMYFTRNSFINNKKQRDKHKVTHLKIYKAQLINNNWTNVTELPFNSNNYSIEHPALNYNETQLYFSSDMPGTIGSFDLFVVEIKKNGSYGKPINLGPKINTEQREQFPFISKNNILYFASDGHIGLGGLDVFKSEIINNNFTTPVHLGEPINSNLDDFSFVIDENDEKGYFSSNRSGGKGDDDIYLFTQLKKYYVSGQAKNKNTLEILPGSTVTLLNDQNEIIETKITEKDAAYSFEIKPNNHYKLKGTLKLFNPAEVSFSTDSKGNINKDIFLLLESYEDAEKQIVKENGKTQIKINPIFFDFDKWNIRSDAKIELESIVTIMKKYPNMVIEIGAHTDCRGSNSYNIELSHKRAKSVRAYLISQGIANLRVKSVGYGETQLLNRCSKDWMCNEKEHAINRRCEFVILN
ncbi:OmpA family protein [Lutibacter sp.]|uniref:OmpA family protein n=1 Tax=Lutibacter sp. TaxID=1925666 RepID=UPI00356183D9